VNRLFGFVATCRFRSVTIKYFVIFCCLELSHNPAMKGGRVMRKVTFLAGVIFALTVFLDRAVQAQNPEVPSKIEIGVQFSSLTSADPSSSLGLGATGATGTTEAGFGGRITFNLNKNIALEAEGNFFPRENFNDVFRGGRLLQGQFGLKAGKRFGKFGLFAKARPGLASFSKVLTQVGATTLDINGQPVTIPIFGEKRKTYFSMDLGGVLEFYPSRKVLTRIDVGDTIIRQNSDGFSPFSFTFNPTAKASHNFQLSAGIGFRLGSLQPEEVTTQAPVGQRKKFEVGAQFSSFGFTEVEHAAGFPGFDFRDTRTQAGFGGRFTYNLNSSVALEAQGDFFPGDAAFFNAARAGGRALQGQAGIKLGKRFERFGIFGKARPGVVSFSRTISFDGFDSSQGFPNPLFHFKRSTYFSLDLGGVLEFYPSRRIVTRFDGGDTMIRYRRSEFPFGISGPIVNSAETIHSFEFSAGVGFRF
jgi:hypothetical protein